MTGSILNSISMNETHIFYDHFHWKTNLEKSLLCKWKVLKPTIELMFRVSSQEISEILLKKTINDCSGNMNCVSTLVKLMDNFFSWQRSLLIVWKELLVYVILQGLSAIIVVLNNLYHSFWKVFMVLCNNWWWDNINWCYKIIK